MNSRKPRKHTARLQAHNPDHFDHAAFNPVAELDPNTSSFAAMCDRLIPALLEYQGSCVVIDPKAELASITERYRPRIGEDILVLNPFNIDPTSPSASRRRS